MDKVWGAMEATTLREVSFQLLGNRYSAEVATAIGRFTDGRFTLTEVARAVGAEKNVVATALKRFEQAGLIKRASPGKGHPYERQDSVYWHMCAALAEEIQGR